MSPRPDPDTEAAWTRRLDRATAAHDKTRTTLDELVADARAAGVPLTTIAKHTPYSREWARKMANRIDVERSNLCGAPNYSDRCELAAGHEGRHKDGNTSWPQGVEHPVDPARAAPARSDEEH